MRISGPGSNGLPSSPRRRGSKAFIATSRKPWVPASAGTTKSAGFTLIELLVVVAIIAFAGAGVSFALRDTAEAQLEREGLRLAALLETARAQSRTSGVAVHWVPAPGGFSFEGLPEKALPQQWLSAETRVQGSATLVLGPEPIIRPQSVVLTSAELPDRSVRVATDGLRPFAVGTAP